MTAVEQHLRHRVARHAPGRRASRYDVPTRARRPGTRRPWPTGRSWTGPPAEGRARNAVAAGC